MYTCTCTGLWYKTQFLAWVVYFLFWSPSLCLFGGMYGTSLTVSSHSPPNYVLILASSHNAGDSTKTHSSGEVLSSSPCSSGMGELGSEWALIVALRTIVFSEPCLASQRWEPPPFQHGHCWSWGSLLVAPSRTDALWLLWVGEWGCKMAFHLIFVCWCTHVFSLWAFGCCHLSFFLPVIKSNLISSRCNWNFISRVGSRTAVTDSGDLRERFRLAWVNK